VTTALPFGLAEIDARLPAGGLVLGALHEVAGGGNGAIDGAAAPTRRRRLEMSIGVEK
jgi:protein ImuA